MRTPTVYLKRLCPYCGEAYGYYERLKWVLEEPPERDCRSCGHPLDIEDLKDPEEYE